MIVPKKQSLAQVMVAVRTKELSEAAQSLGRLLRESGVNTDIYMGPKKIKKSLDYADKKKIPVAVLVMDPNVFVVKNMQNKEHDQGVEYKTLKEAGDAAVKIARRGT